MKYIKQQPGKFGPGDDDDDEEDTDDDSEG